MIKSTIPILIKTTLNVSINNDLNLITKKSIFSYLSKKIIYITHHIVKQFNIH